MSSFLYSSPLNPIPQLGSVQQAAIDLSSRAGAILLHSHLDPSIAEHIADSIEDGETGSFQDGGRCVYDVGREADALCTSTVSAIIREASLGSVLPRVSRAVVITSFPGADPTELAAIPAPPHTACFLQTLVRGEDQPSATREFEGGWRAELKCGDLLLWRADRALCENGNNAYELGEVVLCSLAPEVAL